ncbi:MULTISPECIES: glycerol-3-phosphate 1-O-acyltransferase PlsY [unclassified Romboutsia]|uniref:glycerol-3-phosphate 1-O-acyltransferase PlsY n=1 Tax=unclassified Romboutsia TaxID=2626894 RepID=UPI0008234AA6|nr:MULTISPECIES: glycerol-3-phosphate 1-O-acyltransferase PlsY [unclassified Romboutsia]SCH14880.1 G3P acyltransferase [uncultured Clostridium sp.]
MISYIILIIIAYLLGNISTSTIIARKMFNVDIRTQGSGNPGSTNVLRTLGKKAGAMTFAGDLLKGLVAVLIARVIARFTGCDEVTSAYLAVVAVVAGHNWPVFLKFKGGKGVATSLGAMIGMNPVIALSCFGIFLIVVAITKYVSLGSIIGIAASPLFMIATNNKKGIFVTLFLTASVIYTHRANIQRLVSGTERKIGAKK